MNPPSPSGRVVAALLGLLIGGASGFLLTESVGAFLTFVLGRTLDVDGTGTLLAAFIAVPILCALGGAVIGVRRAGRPQDQNKGW